ESEFLMSIDVDPKDHRGSIIARWLIAGPLVLIVTLLTWVVMPLWVPKGPSGFNNILLSLIALPLIWAVLFHYALLEHRQWRSALILVALLIAHGIALYFNFAGGI
ncbi:MAG: hypothetical protein AAF870_02355, partial [Pseudomonadota bacterium]